MHISWGTKIAALYGGFVVLIVSLVIGTTFKKSDLVTDDYYHQETVFQQRLDAMDATAALKEQVQLNRQGDAVELVFPASFADKTITGEVHFYAPSAASADRKFPLVLNDNKWSVSKSELASVPYEVQISWTANGKAYYQSISFK